MVRNLRSRLQEVGKKSSAPARDVAQDCLVKESIHPLHEKYGLPLHSALESCAREVSLMCDVFGFDARRALFFDTETTGLAGAGTVAFLVGLGYYQEDGFHVEQLLMRDYPEEIFVLQRFIQRANEAEFLVSFNGKSFDLPLLQSRLTMMRLRGQLPPMAHVDLLHPARRVWKLRLEKCNLGHLEEHILGVPRQNDIPGSEIPARFFDYLKTGNFTLLQDILEHNEKDILAMPMLLASLTRAYRAPAQQLDMRDIFSLGRALERAGADEVALDCYEAVNKSPYKIMAQTNTSRILRKTKRSAQAKALHEKMIAEGAGVYPYIELAKHYEHREKNIEKALEITDAAIAYASEAYLPELFTRRARLSRRVIKKRQQEE